MLLEIHVSEIPQEQNLGDEACEQSEHDNNDLS